MRVFGGFAGACPPTLSSIALKPMNAKPFLDTNVLLYMLSADAAKADAARALLARGGTISVQVLNEAANVLTRKVRMEIDEARKTLADIRRFCTIEPLTIAVHDQALAVAGRYGFSIYDSLIVSTAMAAGCSTLYSEDLQHGQEIGTGLTIANPFL
ncbi:MAG: PIN domain-containing protein [Microvirga sp.]